MPIVLPMVLPRNNSLTCVLQVIDTVTSSGSGYSSLQDSLARHGAGGGQADQQLVRHILKLLSAKVTT